MSFKILFVFGLLVASSWAVPVPTEDEVLPKTDVLPEDEVLPGSAKAAVEFNLGDLKCDDENVEKFVDEKVVNTENGVSASATASLKVPMKVMKFDLKEFFDKLNARWEEMKKKIEENKNSVKCENVDESKEVDSAEKEKSPFRFSFRVCSTASAKASAKASSRFCSNDEVQPANDETVVATPNGPIAVPKPVVVEPVVVEPVVAEPVVVEPVVAEPVVAEPVVGEPVVVKPVVDEPPVVKTDEPVELVEETE